ncbi:bifunctional riboflavin kinase/FAD synthetase [Dehalobacterium formicoaceticum]|uniref:Riboflavin biosynthesis protein n=1 Tax=Dehalobacterium formicoaceticum TaxID=51515 RepID=A0ABT1Y4U3_9FIRM|nr:bifunctional riboflavin kinase/FAD synthetase [Dehalobacterium formicoaceticum]MCR6545899.1 bifunctional riboflavin kinase/FAD synthetase [Dehalobacterium formicoaceticum]
MKVINNLADFPRESNFVAVAMGNFDGVHRGHQKLIQQMVAKAHQENGLAVVFTFHPHPLLVLKKKNNLLFLNTQEEKEWLIRSLGTDIYFPFPFDQKIAEMMPENFVKDILMDGLGAKAIFIGYNFTFGRKAMGDPELLKSLCPSYGCEVNVVPEIKIDDIHVSSSKIRNFLKKGNIIEANRFLGYPYSLSGMVVPGQQLGRKLGFPTANLNIMPGLLTPEKGVYAVKVQVGDQLFDGVANVGNRPTIGDNLPENVEVHLLNKNLDLYDQEIRVFFMEKLRGEKKFSDLSELTFQVQADISAAEEYLRNRKDWKITCHHK